MDLLITGANGFLGQHVVRVAFARGHHVRAIIRPTADAGRLLRSAAAEPARLEVVRHDLRDARSLSDRVRGADAVLHLAAAKTGDYYTQMAGTVVATENLLAAMRQAGVNRLVLTSSFAVYDYLAVPIGGTLDEASPLEREPARRDDYCRTKLWQERLVREATVEQDLRAVVLRPGVVYAEPDHLWTDRLGIRAGQIFLATGSHARLPLTHVHHCANAVVRAAECEQAVGQVLNLVDDDPPSQRRYRRALRPVMRSRVVPVNWTLLRLVVWMLDAIDRRLLGGGAKWPAILRRRALHARCRPLRYSNQRARDVLGWSAPACWRETINAVVAAEDSSERSAAVAEHTAIAASTDTTSHSSQTILSSTDKPCASRT